MTRIACGKERRAWKKFETFRISRSQLCMSCNLKQRVSVMVYSDSYLMFNYLFTFVHMKSVSVKPLIMSFTLSSVNLSWDNST
jgi:hypothetical protein